MARGAGKHFTYAQLEGLWINAGGPRAVAPIAAAIAEAESGGWSGAKNPSGATGLWQILGDPFKGNALDPQTNARMAVAKYRAAGNKFTPWVTYTNGAYKRFLNTKTTPAGVSPTPNPQPNAPPTAPKGGSGGGGTVSGSSPSGTAPGTCLIGVGWSGVPGTSLWNDVFGSGGNVGAFKFCFFTKSNARALIGGMEFAAGGLLLVTGTAILIAHAFAASGAGKKAGSLLEGVGAGVALIPGAEAAGAGIAASGKGVKSASAHVQKKRVTKNKAADKEEREYMRAVGEPRENPDLEVHGGVSRETAAQTAARKRRQAAAARSRARAYAQPAPKGKHHKQEAVPF